MDISAEIAAIQAASQGSELRQPLVGALNKLNSGSLPAVTASDAGKILKVGANGWEVGEKSGYIPTPTASVNISSNGTHDVTNYAEAVVDVQPSGKITITQNGTDIDVSNYALADVTVSGGATLTQKSITQNGTYNPVDDNADGYSEVTVNVPSGSSNVLLMNHGQVSDTSVYMTAYFQNPIDFSEYDFILVILYEDQYECAGMAKQAGSFYIGRSGGGYSGSAFAMNISSSSINCSNYRGSFKNLYVDVYGVKI